MAISFVAASAIVTGSNPTVAIPAGVVENDFLVIIYRGTATPATPAGWTSRAAQGAGNFLTIFYDLIRHFSIKYASINLR